MDCSPPNSSVHWILQARILEWLTIPFSRGSSWPRDRTQVSCTAGRFFTICATREARKNTGLGSLSLFQGIFPDPGIEPGSPALQVDSFPAELPGKPQNKKEKSPRFSHKNFTATIHNIMDQNMLLVSSRQYLVVMTQSPQRD